VLQKDRAVSLADQPIGGHFENFAPMIARIEAHAYDKILLHNYHKEQFLYDWFMWRHPSGVRKALQEHYQEIRTIPGVTNKDGSEIWYLQFVTDVSVLVPKK
jgi:hypothetical protein